MSTIDNVLKPLEHHNPSKEKKEHVSLARKQCVRAAHSAGLWRILARKKTDALGPSRS